MVVVAGLIFSVGGAVASETGDSAVSAFFAVVLIGAHWFFFCMCAYGLWRLVKFVMRWRRRRMEAMGQGGGGPQGGPE